MARFQSTSNEFKKVKEGLMNDIKIMQTQHINSQKQLKIAEEILNKTKEEYKKLNNEYVKLENYKNKCEKYITYLRNENSDIQLKLNKLYEERQTQQSRNTFKRAKSNNYHWNKIREEEQDEENQEQDEEEVEEEEYITEDVPLKSETKQNKPPPKKKLKKKGISNFI